jgi:hypothetical protein
MMSLKRDAAYRTLLLEPIESTIYEKDLQQICDMLWSYQDLCLDELAGYMCQARRYRVTLNDDKGTMLAQRVLYLGLNPAETSVVDFLQRWLTLDQVDP